MSNADKNEKNNVIDWEKVMENYELTATPNEFVQQVFTLTTSLLAQQMDSKNINEISVEMGEFELILKRAKSIKKAYNH